MWTRDQRNLLIATMIGSVAPDIDMLWFHLADGGRVHHHEYLTHKPVLWLSVLIAGLLLRKPTVVAFGIGAMVHMVLDSFLGAITWLWPLSHASAPLVVVPASYDNWVLSFLFHWSFLVEIALVIAALIVAYRSYRQPQETT